MTCFEIECSVPGRYGHLGRVSYDVFCNLFLLYLVSTYITTTCQI